MPEQNPRKTRNTKPSRKRIGLVAIVVVITIVSGCFIWSTWNSKSVEQQLAELEAARAIPDSENAALLYNKLMQDPNATSLANWPQFIISMPTDQSSWSSEDYAKRAVWVEEKQPVIDALLKASNFDKCRFPIVGPHPAWRAMRIWRFLIRPAVINDIANGRIDDAISKWRCLLKMGNHLRQQPLFGAHFWAFTIEAAALKQMTAFLVQGNVQEAHLRRIEALPLHTKDNWAAALEEITPAQELAVEIWKGQLDLIERIKYTIDYDGFGSVTDDDIAKIRRQYYELLARSRGLHVLVALRRYKNKHGYWPEKLDQIKTQVPPEMFIDPFGSALTYRLIDDSFYLHAKRPNTSFYLYSIGPNKIDGGRNWGSSDDFLICPPPINTKETGAKRRPKPARIRKQTTPQPEPMTKPLPLE